jgi:hypothetical protein
MPQYEYECPRCGNDETRITSIAGRDGQVCGREIEVDVGYAPAGRNITIGEKEIARIDSVAVVLDGQQADPNAKGKMKMRCGAQLVRIEIPSSQSNMADKRWFFGVRTARGELIKGALGTEYKNRKGFGP